MADKPLIIFGDGKQTRDFTFVEDSARGILLAGTSDKAVGETLNIGSNHEITIKELAEIVKGVAGKPDAEVIYDAHRPGDVLRLYADSSKAGALLGFEPQVTMNEGLQRLKAWYDAQPYSAVELLEAEKIRNWEKQ
jgi:UDP-glucose 4-epimerase